MRASLSTYESQDGSHAAVGLKAGLAVQMGALGAEVRVCAPDFAGMRAGMMATGGWR